MSADGSNPRRLTNDLKLIHPPSWSPDGRRIAVSGRTSDNNNDEIWILNVDDLKLTNLTMDPASDIAPAWSPDGNRITFDSNRDGDYQIYSIDLTSRNVQQLTHGIYVNFHSRWSPDGTKILYSCGNADAASLICMMTPDGQLLSPQYRESGTDPIWSPDGSSILFGSGHFFRVMDQDGSHVTILLDFENAGLWSASSPSWQLKSAN